MTDRVPSETCEIALFKTLLKVCFWESGILPCDAGSISFMIACKSWSCVSLLLIVSKSSGVVALWLTSGGDSGVCTGSSCFMVLNRDVNSLYVICLLYTSPSPRD